MKATGTKQLLVAALVVAGAMAARADAGQCPEAVVYSPRAEGTDEALRQLSTWLGAWSDDGLRRPLLSASEIAQLNQANALIPGSFQDVIHGGRRTAAIVGAELEERFEWLAGRVDAGHYVEGSAGALALAEHVARSSRPVDQLRVVARAADLHCVPLRSGLFTLPVDLDFDRNQCSSLHPGEVVHVGRVSRDGMWRYVHSGHSVGWLWGPVLTPPLAAAEAERFRDSGQRLVVVGDWVPTSAGVVLRLGTDFPLLGASDTHWQIIVPQPDGLAEAFVSKGEPVHPGFPPLTRGNVLRVVMQRMGDAYGWGGFGGGRDCSRLLLDTFASFGLRLGRHSGVQARSGAAVVDVAGMEDAAKRRAIREAGAKGIVFLYMPGHIMLYLGEFRGRPFAVSAISEYKRPCSDQVGGAEQTIRLDKVEVTNLELGRGTSKTAFIERIAKLAIFGPRGP